MRIPVNGANAGLRFSIFGPEPLQYDKALKTLEETQSKRRIQEKRALEEAANLYDLHKEDSPEPEAAPYNPKEDGFVYSVAQIDTYLSRQIRVHRSLKCQDRRYNTART